MSGATTTSGLAWKIPGRAGDSPIIGAGCYCDQDVGAAGATGNGEENIKICGGHTIVENMRHGMSPEEAGMDALKRIVRNYNGDMHKLAYMDMTLLHPAQRRRLFLRNVVGGTARSSEALRRPRRQRQTLRERAKPLFEGASLGWPPMPGGKKLKPEAK